MKKLLVIFSLISFASYSQATKLTSYVSPLDNNEYSIYVTEKELGYDIHIETPLLENGSGGFTMNRDEHKRFLDVLIYVKTKYVEWTAVANDNNVPESTYKSLNKPFLVKPYFYLGNKEFQAHKTILQFYFGVAKFGTYIIALSDTELKAISNPIITHNQLALSFIDEKSLNDFINKITVSKVYTHLSNKKENLFKF
jgi:hypothetical protein